MKTKVALLFFSITFLFFSCTSFNPAMLNPDLAEVSTKIARLEISSPSTTTFSDSTIKTTNYQSMYFTIFERELRTNLMDTIGEKYGNIELTIIYDRYKKNNGLLILSSVLLFMPNIVGMPLGSIEQYTEIEVKIYDKKANEIARYNISKNIKKYLGLYYNYKYEDIDYVKVLVFKEIMRDLRLRITKDAKAINGLLK